MGDKPSPKTTVHQPHRQPLNPEWAEPVPADVAAEPFENRQKWINKEPGGVRAYRRQSVYWNRREQARMSRSEKYLALGITDVAECCGLEEDEVFEGLRVLLVGRLAPYLRWSMDPWGKRPPHSHWTPATVTVRPKGGLTGEIKPAVMDNQLLDYWLRRLDGRRHWLSTPRAWHAWWPDEWLADCVWFDLDDHDGLGHLLRRYLIIIGVLGPPAFVASSSTRPEIEIPAGPVDLNGIQFGYDLRLPTTLGELKVLEQRVERLLELHAPNLSSRTLQSRVVEVFPTSPGRSLRVCLGVDSYVLDPQTLVPIADGPPNAVKEVFDQWCRYYEHNEGPPTIRTLIGRLNDALKISRASGEEEESSPSCSPSAVEVHDVPASQDDHDSRTGRGRYFWEHGLPGEESRVEYVKSGIYYEYTNVDGAHTQEEMFEKVYDHFSANNHGFSTLWNRSRQEFAHWLRATIREEFKWYEAQGIEPWRHGRPALYPSSDDIDGMVDLVEHSASLRIRDRLPTLRFLYELSQYVLTRHGSEITMPFTVPIPQKSFLGMPHCTNNQNSGQAYVGQRKKWLYDEKIISKPERQYKLFRFGFHRCYEYIWNVPLSAEDQELGVDGFLVQLPDRRLDELFSPYHRRKLRAG